MCQFVSVRSLLISLFYSVPSPCIMKHNDPHLCNQKLRVSYKLSLIPLLLLTRKPLYFFFIVKSIFASFFPLEEYTKNWRHQIRKSQSIRFWWALWHASLSQGRLLEYYTKDGLFPWAQPIYREEILIKISLWLCSQPSHHQTKC